MSVIWENPEDGLGEQEGAESAQSLSSGSSDVEEEEEGELC